MLESTVRQIRLFAEQWARPEDVDDPSLERGDGRGAWTVYRNEGCWVVIYEGEASDSVQFALCTTCHQLASRRGLLAFTLIDLAYLMGLWGSMTHPPRGMTAVGGGAVSSCGRCLRCWKVKELAAGVVCDECHEKVWVEWRDAGWRQWAVSGLLGDDIGRLVGRGLVQTNVPTPLERGDRGG